MAWSKAKPVKGKAAEAAQERPQHAMRADDWHLFCFEAEDTGDWLRMRCKLSSKAADGEKYGKGVRLTVMARIRCQKTEGDLTTIPEGSYVNCWITVDGRLTASDWKGKNGIQTDITIFADKVTPDEV